MVHLSGGNRELCRLRAGSHALGSFYVLAKSCKVRFHGAFRSRKVVAQLGELLEPRPKAFEIEKLVTVGILPVELFVLVKLEAIWAWPRASDAAEPQDQVGTALCAPSRC